MRGHTKCFNQVLYKQSFSSQLLLTTHFLKSRVLTNIGTFSMSPTMIAYGYLAIAIVCEVIGTTFLVKSEQFTRFVPTLIMAVLYAISFYLLTQTIKTIPIGIAYALWGGLGIVLTSLVGLFFFKQTLDTAAVIGIAMIVGGVVVMNLLSDSVAH